MTNTNKPRDVIKGWKSGKLTGREDDFTQHLVWPSQGCLKFWITYSLILHTSNKLETWWLNSINNRKPQAYLMVTVPEKRFLLHRSSLQKTFACLWRPVAFLPKLKMKPLQTMCMHSCVVLMTQKSCKVGTCNAILRNHLTHILQV